MLPAQNKEAQKLSLIVGLWVVKYDKFPGKITSLDGDDIEVNAMTKSAKTGSGKNLKTKMFWTSLLHQLLLEIKDSLGLQTSSCKHLVAVFTYLTFTMLKITIFYFCNALNYKL